MTLGRHGQLTKSISVMCAIALQFNAFADWRADWKSFAEETKRSASTAWCETKSSLDSAGKWVSRQCDEVAAGWDGFVENTKQTASAAYEKSINGLNDAKQWASEHGEEIVAAVAVVAVVVAACNGKDASSYQPSSSPKYLYVTSHSQEGPYKPFSAKQKAEILQQNRTRNGGVLRSDYSGKILEEPRRYTKGCAPNPNEAQIDHITPRSLGGWNSAENAQVLSREENLKKSDNLKW